MVGRGYADPASRSLALFCRSRDAYNRLNPVKWWVSAQRRIYKYSIMPVIGRTSASGSRPMEGWLSSGVLEQR